MSKYRLSKSAIVLSLAILAASTSQLARADETASQPTEPTTDSLLVTTTSSDSLEQIDVADAGVTPVAESNETLEQTTDTSLPVVDTVESPATPEQDLTPVEGQTVDVRILSTTDLHTNLVNYDYYQDKPSQKIGLAKTAVLINKAKEENPNTVMVDSGDLIQGTPLGTYKATVEPVAKGEEHPMYQALQTIGFDAAALGNHEFNYGMDYLNTILDSAKLPILNANVIDAKSLKPVFKTYEMVTKTFTDTTGRQVALNIGITGIVPPQILNWDKINLEGKVLVKDSVETVKEMVPFLREKGADIVLVVAHSGIGDDKYEKGEENVSYQLASIEGVDAVATGHSHAEFPTGTGTGFYGRYAGVDDVTGKINGTPVTMAGKYGDHLGVIDLGLLYTDGKWQVKSSKSELRKIDSKSEEADPTILNLAKDVHEKTIAYIRQQVGTTTAPIHSYFSLVKDDPSVQIVNNAQLWYLKKELAGTEDGKLPILSAAAPFKAGARGDATAYTDIPKGPLAIKNVADLYLYDNITAVLKITGKDLKEWLEMSAGQFNQVDPSSTEPQQIINTSYRTYNFDVIDGVTYAFDITQPNKYNHEGKLVNPSASRVRDLRYQGQPVRDEQEFMVATNNYRASGKFPGVRDAKTNRILNLENRQVIINYILEEKIINPSADGNWRFADTIKGLNLRFLTADRAKNLVTDTDIAYIQAAQQEGFGEFQFIYQEPKADVEQSTESKEELKEEKLELDKNTTTTPTSNQTLSKTEPVFTQTMAVKSYHAPKEQDVKLEKQVPSKTLPNTSSQDASLFSWLGFGLLSLVGLFSKKRKG